MHRKSGEEQGWANTKTTLYPRFQLTHQCVPRQRYACTLSSLSHHRRCDCHEGRRGGRRFDRDYRQQAARLHEVHDSEYNSSRSTHQQSHSRALHPTCLLLPCTGRTVEYAAVPLSRTTQSHFGHKAVTGWHVWTRGSALGVCPCRSISTPSRERSSLKKAHFRPVVHSQMRILHRDTSPSHQCPVATITKCLCRESAESQNFLESTLVRKSQLTLFPP
mmetsp:Transcript_34162/g.88196  ORF Transcript_34162/g.88196 Transcript_34162/m.88196 type:complete len:219 (-) Transcript_34162:1669-2325(-)